MKRAMKPRPCPRCKGTRVEAGGRKVSKWVENVLVEKFVLDLCKLCHGRGTVLRG